MKRRHTMHTWRSRKRGEGLHEEKRVGWFSSQEWFAWNPSSGFGQSSWLHHRLFSFMPPPFSLFILLHTYICYFVYFICCLLLIFIHLLLHIISSHFIKNVYREINIDKIAPAILIMISFLDLKFYFIHFQFHHVQDLTN